MDTAIETNDLVKVFGTTRALNGIDLLIRGGTVHGLLGPNGAGKKTAIRVLAMLFKPTRGLMHCIQAGHDVLWGRAAAAGITLVASPIPLHMYHKER